MARVNPIHGFAGAALAALDRVTEAPAWALSDADLTESVLELTRARAELDELLLRVLAEADRREVGSATGATSTAAWLAQHTRQTRKAAHADVRLARSLDRPILDTVRRALAEGRLHVEQARVIVHVVEDLPDGEVSDAQRVAAQEHLVGKAAEHDARDLRVLGARIFEVIAPEEADRRVAQKLEDEERRARETSRFGTRDNGDGTTNGWFKLPTAQAEMLTKAVHAFAAPRRNHLKGNGSDQGGWVDPDGRPVPWAVQLGQAFAELIEHLPTDKLPRSGGLNASVTVTMSLQALRSGLGSGVLDTGSPVSPGQTRRLCCNAGMVPMVLGSPSQVLDVGQEVRLHTKPMRQAIAVRDKECTAEGCDRPAAWCEVHHRVPFSKGGATSVENGRLLCPRHHHHAHDSGFDMRVLPDGQVRFNRRT
ncbi:MAG: DUF222 domain-containing protein [Nocardioides sp.]